MNTNKGKQKFFVIYQITNLLDNHIYVGLHSTFNIDDKYMGSSKHLKKDLKELGRKNFKKEILHIFDNKEDMIKMEAKIVNREFCHRIDTYNRMVGGTNDGLTIDMITVKDKNGNTSKIYNDDPRWLSGELVHVTKGTITVRDLKGKYFRVLPDDERFKTGEIEMCTKGLIVIKDKNNNIFSIKNNDPRYLSGELVGYSKGNIQHPNQSWTGKKHSEDTKNKMSEKAKLKTGELNSSFGTCWITKDKENKKIKKENLDEWIIQGWIRGRKQHKN